MERSEARGSFNAGQVPPPLVVADFINRLFPRCSGSPIGALGVGRLFVYRPVCVIQRFKEVFEKVLEEIDAGRELDIDVAVVFQDEPRNVGHNGRIFKMATTMFEVTWQKKFKKCFSFAARGSGPLSLKDDSGLTALGKPYWHSRGQPHRWYDFEGS